MQNETMATIGIKDTAKSSDEIMLRQAIIAEYDAVNLYEQMAKSTSNPKLKKLFLDVAEEEKVHIGEFEAMLDKTDKSHEASVKDGKKEAGKFTEWLKKKQAIPESNRF